MTSLDYYNIEELLTDEERAARDRARRFVQEEVAAEIVPCHRATKFPEHLIARMGGSCRNWNEGIQGCARLHQCKALWPYKQSIHLAPPINTPGGYRGWSQVN